MNKFTPAYIALCRKAKGDVWVFSEALDEIERSHDMIERLIEAGDINAEVSLLEGFYGVFQWNALTSEWRSQ